MRRIERATAFKCDYRRAKAISRGAAEDQGLLTRSVAIIVIQKIA
jgi:hypothetical protein